MSFDDAATFEATALLLVNVASYPGDCCGHTGVYRVLRAFTAKEAREAFKAWKKARNKRGGDLAEWLEDQGWLMRLACDEWHI